MNKGISIKARIGLTMAFLAALLVGIGAFGLFGMGRSNDAYQETFTNSMPSAVDIGNAELFAARERLALDRAAFMMGTPESAPTLERARTMRATSDKWWQKYMDLPRGPEEDRLAREVIVKREALHQQADAFAAVVAAGEQGKLVDGAKRMQVAYNELAGADDALRKFQFDAAKAGYDAAQANFQQFRMVSIGALVAGALAALLSYMALSRAIARPLSEALVHFDAIAAGDLRRQVAVTSRDEMGQILEGIAKMQRSLIETVRAVRGGSESIATATREIAAGNIDLSSRTEEQASALQQTASSMEELTGTVKQNADNARQASALAANASEIANKGSAVVGQVVGTMGEINQSSAKIADIISIIEGIAFQTNILALNAAVEAARAGEDGRGFAVVAGEVRSLAQRSSAAAKEIKELIDTSVDRVQSGSALVDEAGRTMGEIISAVQRVTDIMGEIAAASEEQSGGIDQVARAVTQMDEVTQQNAALVEEAAAAASSLEDQADKLRQAVAVFQLGDDAGKASASAAAKHVPLRAASAVARPASRVAGRAGSAAPAAAAVAAQPVSAGHAPAAAASPAPVAAAAAAKSNPVPRATAKPAAAASVGGDQDWETF
ncbi:methyl-accepting chemotaxis protein [bacterium M00.F.Ca.ET.228.01.1.1]|uniref:methyl-accepting chemotaxis protein n=1 Tax=Paraburkholderia phenoliruptrix TaxID=252970 RepID=UPI001092AB04|nr:methyl-accepting chemotaxis protein [Paraburkholderia phenoliruptrix]TGP42255.1 methyl-accepting chemotaxis protein [bacterium M00.F.Ca.ET.228.01.1.1]TGR99904.1 methyl-accepting chemotaxis protein [bacterium M00.F.Ca.ET.191.01.1.1]TGU04225.1 methyl-accepting chemotaxis protein [bacterium M00.F.Ca.ET.155.01.1.1]MBW0448653.1 Tar ligand binding domain-containing protein [Paraburkholderia phenoliruptrix]MBW9100485.1 Tar ligand binding domain-containing protein [Paraburkholderia phenoliruptrix]